jgi:hypothetical protein
MADVFLSYAHEDEETMRRLRADLMAAGLTVWTDEGLEPGEPSWQRAIEEAIEGAGCLAVILSPPAKDSEWVNREIGYAGAKKLRNFPVLARGDEGTSVPIALINAQYVDLRSEYDKGVKSLVTAISGHLGGAQRPGASALRQEGSSDPDGPTIHPPPLATDRVRFRRSLSDHFSSSELGELTYDLGLDYGDLPGSGKSAKIIELITYFERRGRYDELVQAAQAARPELEW